MPKIKSPTKRKRGSPKKRSPVKKSPRKMNLSMKKSPYGKLNKKINRSKSVSKKSTTTSSKTPAKKPDDMSYGEMFTTMAKLTNSAIKKAGGFTAIANRARKYIEKLNITNTTGPKSKGKAERIQEKIKELIYKFEDKMKEFEDYIEEFRKLNDYISKNRNSELSENQDFARLYHILNEEGNIVTGYEELKTSYNNWLEQTKLKILKNDCETTKSETTECMELMEEMVMTFTYFTEDLTNAKNIFHEARDLGNRLDLYDTISMMRGRSNTRGPGFSRFSRGPRSSGFDRVASRASTTRDMGSRGPSGFDRIGGRASMMRDTRSTR